MKTLARNEFKTLDLVLCYLQNEVRKQEIISQAQVRLYKQPFRNTIVLLLEIESIISP